MLNSVKIAYIGGGSRSWARKLMVDLAIQEGFSGEMRLYDINESAAADNVVIGNMISNHKDAKSSWKYTLSKTLQECLSGADFVVISILPGTFKEMESDVHVPEKYGIYQTVGDTSGPGGIIRSMRSVSMFEVIGKAIKDTCPEAFVINFTNPMTLCTRTLYSVFPEIKAFGCCHEVFGTQKFLGKVVAKALNIEEIRRQEIDVDVMGINHFTWFTRAEYKGIDIFPIYREYAKEELSKKPGVPKGIMESAENVKMDLFLRYGQIAAAGDRHLVEFLNNKWYLADKNTIEKWGFVLTPVSWRVEDLNYKCEQTKRILEGKEEINMQPSGEESVILMGALLGLYDFVSNVNLPNRGRMDYADYEAIIETNAKFTKGKILPLSGKPLNRQVSALVRRISMQQENVFDAIIKRDLIALQQLFLNEPLCSTLTLDEGCKLFYNMINNCKEYLSDWQAVSNL